MNLLERSCPYIRKSFWTRARLALTLLALGSLALLGLSACNSTDKKTPLAAASPSPGAVVKNSPVPGASLPPAFVELPQAVRDTKVETLDGGSLKLSDFDKKVVVVNIWATWCGPCRLEMPELVKMNSEFKSRGLVVLGLATSYNEHNDRTHVQDFIRSQKIDYKIIWDDGTLASPLVDAVRAQSVIPQSFVIDREGRIVKHFQGFNPYSTPQLMRQAIDDALN